MENTAENRQPLSFPAFYAKESQIPFFVMLGLFALSNMLLVINFTPEAAELVGKARLAINTLLLWLCPMYFAFNLIMWRMKPWTVAVGVASIAGVFAVWNLLGGYVELFCTVVAAFLALLAYRRDYRTVLQIFLVAHLVTILAAVAGLKIGYAVPRYKLGTQDFGVSLGLIYPNHLGRMVFIVLVLAWYLWGQKRRALTTAVFWVTAVVMWQWVKCKTIALFMVAFPVCWWATTLLLLTQRRMQTQPLRRGLHRVWNALMIAMPFLMLAFTYAMGRQKIWLDAHYSFGTAAYSLAMRFISAGILFQVYGFPLWGRDILNETAPMEFMNNHIYTADVVDNAYIYYMIALGGIALVIVLAWLCLANARMVREGDHALLLISVFMLAYGLIEIVAFQFEHNFIWFYPLAATAALAGIADDALGAFVLGLVFIGVAFEAG
ncbi:MAG: hypothetical protein IJJ45_01670, partial [Clostridia bacterium]|nr:hypothetical protein [Clostridia bacterium]